MCRALAGRVETSLGAAHGTPRSRSFALAVGYAILGLIQGVITDDQLDVTTTVAEFVDRLPPELRAGEVA